MTEPSDPHPRPAEGESHRGEHNEIPFRIVDEEADHDESSGPQQTDDDTSAGPG